MGILELTVTIAVVLTFVFLGTQIVWPIVTGEPLFPIFRKSAVKSVIKQAEHQLEEVAELAHLNKLMADIQRRKAEMEKKE